MKIFTSEQVREIDRQTILNEPVSSADLMERAASRLFNWYIEEFDRSHRILVFVGPGNNGGDGLALSRMLFKQRYNVEIYYVKFSEKTSPDWEANRKRLEKETTLKLKVISVSDDFPVCFSGDIIVDAIFGSGLTRSPEGITAEIIRKINSLNTTVIAVDIPSGLGSEDNNSRSSENIIRATFTLCFQFPKISFLFPESVQFTGEWIVLPIGLDEAEIEATLTPYFYLEEDMIRPLLKKRGRFDHKGIFGHGLLIGGSFGKIGAVVLGAEAALRTGAGLVTCHIPSCGYSVLQCTVPEAMISADRNDKIITNPGPLENYSAIAVGPGLGKDPSTQKMLYDLLHDIKKPLVLDADAINILSENPSWITYIPHGTILTPHIREFERMTGKADNSHIRLSRQIEFSVRNHCVVILKGAFTSISSSDGNVYFNSTGNPGMATAGSGDVLTGMILSLLAQGYDSLTASITGVYLHGLAGDISAARTCQESLIASDIIASIHEAYNRIRGTD